MFSERRIILTIVLLVCICITGYVILVFIPSTVAEKSYQAAQKVSKDIREALQFTPQVTVNNMIIVQQESPLFELVTLSQKFYHQYEWTNQWMGSTKKIKITGTFEAKAGFDLNESFTIDIDANKAIVQLPSPKILAVESASDIKFEDEHGVWNWINESDRSAAINAFTSDARRYAEKAAFRDEALRVARERIREIILRHVEIVEFGASPHPIE